MNEKIEELTLEQSRVLLEMLQMEQERRLQQKVEAGQAVSISVTVVNDVALDDEALEVVRARAAEKHLQQNPLDAAKEMFVNVMQIVTGVPRAPEGEAGLGG